ncbi:MAG: pilus assembly protein, partial [Alphaproteobacteria bacterium]|nr:pilus assembly protein [Alphaproteobacteria bacterium]
MLKQLIERSGIRHCQRGNVAIETAFAIPMLVGLALGAAEFGRAFSSKSELANVARAGAQAAIEFSGEDESLSDTVRDNLILAGLIADPNSQGFDIHAQPQTSVQ